MNVRDAITNRRTVRGFKSDRVPTEILTHILKLAAHAPSNCNTQPWHIAIVSGDARVELESRLIAEATSGKAPSPAFGFWDKGISGHYKDRRFACAAELYGVLGIARDDKKARDKQTLQNWHFFGAPHAGFISMPTSLGILNAVDIGIFLQSLMLLFVEFGIASCPQVALGYFPDPIYDIADIPEGNGIVCGISFGYADDDALINQVRMDRAPLSEIASFVE